MDQKTEESGPSPVITNPQDLLVRKQVYRGHPLLNADDSNNDPITITFPTTEIIGKGSFGLVFCTTIRETDEVVAIKKVLQDRRFKNRELEIMKLIQHPNVINLKYYFYEKDVDDEVI